MTTEIPGYYRPCIYKCEPYELIFDPNTGSCEYPDQAPPGLCVDTPEPTFTPPATDDTTTEKPTTTTEEPTTTTEEPTTTTEEPTTTTEEPTTTTEEPTTTTEEPTTTTEEPTTTTEEPTTTTTEEPTTTTEEPTTTTEEPTTTTSEPLITGNPDDCEFDGQTYPYPGDCHLYYICLPGDDGSYVVEIFDCGELVYDPNTGSCQFPENPDDLLCESVRNF